MPQRSSSSFYCILYRISHFSVRFFVLSLLPYQSGWLNRKTSLFIWKNQTYFFLKSWNACQRTRPSFHLEGSARWLCQALHLDCRRLLGLWVSLVLDWEAGASALPPYAAARQHGAVRRARGLETFSSSSPHQLCDFTSRHWHSVRVSCYHQHLLVTKCHQQEDTIISSRHYTEHP